MRAFSVLMTATVFLFAAGFLWAGEEAPVGSGEEAPPLVIPSRPPIRSELQSVSGVRGWLVNGKEISLDDVAGKCLLFHGPYVLQDMVAAVLLEQEAERLGVSVTATDVEAKIREVRAELGLGSEAAFESYLRSNRMTRIGFLEKARDYALMEKVLSGKVYVSDAEVASFYHRSPRAYRSPETVVFRMLTLPTEQQARAALKELGSGRSFEVVADALATDPREKTATPRIHARGQGPPLPPELETTLYSAQLNQVVGPIRTQVGYHLIRVEKKTDAHQFTLDEVRELIRRQLRRQRLEQKAWPDWISDQLEKADIGVLKVE